MVREKKVQIRELGSRSFSWLVDNMSKIEDDDMTIAESMKNVSPEEGLTRLDQFLKDWASSVSTVDDIELQAACASQNAVRQLKAAASETRREEQMANVVETPGRVINADKYFMSCVCKQSTAEKRRALLLMMRLSQSNKINSPEQLQLRIEEILVRHGHRYVFNYDYGTDD